MTRESLPGVVPLLQSQNVTVSGGSQAANSWQFSSRSPSLLAHGTCIGASSLPCRMPRPGVLVLRGEALELELNLVFYKR